MKPWQLGNTTVRSGLRTRDALIALDDAGIEGNIRGQAGDRAFRDVLGQAGVVDLGVDTTASVGRKFRSAMTHLGFLYPVAPSGIEQSSIGPPDCITPAGRRFIAATSAIAQQECFLRSLVGRSIDLSNSRYQSPGDFSPLLHTLRVMKALDTQTGESSISFIEFAAFVQTTGNETNQSEIVDRILEFRSGRATAQNKRQFDEAAIAEQRHIDGDIVAVSTYRDYADMNFRYLRATGLFSQRGRGLSFFDERADLVESLLETIIPISDQVAYWTSLTLGPRLPFDNLEGARENLVQLVKLAEDKKLAIEFDISKVATPADAEVARHEIEERIALIDEVEFARSQSEEWEKISKYLVALESGRARVSREDEDVVVIPSGESAAYLEWAVWRAFLAVNRLENPPYQSRRFPVDRDFLPIRNAPGGGPDLIFEFESFVLVVEVTLLTSGRQEAAEGYPVRQHVFQVKQEYESRSQKPVYGLFVAPEMNPNSVATFRLGQWHEDDDEVRLDIVPITIRQFNSLFRGMFENSAVDNLHVLEFLNQCLRVRDSDNRPSEWQRAIAESVDYVIGQVAISQ